MAAVVAVLLAVLPVPGHAALSGCPAAHICFYDARDGSGRPFTMHEYNRFSCINLAGFDNRTSYIRNRSYYNIKVHQYPCGHSGGFHDWIWGGSSGPMDAAHDNRISAMGG